MAGEWLPVRLSPSSQFWLWGTENSFETATSHKQTVDEHWRNSPRNVNKGYPKKGN